MSADSHRARVTVLSSSQPFTPKSNGREINEKRGGVGAESADEEDADRLKSVSQSEAAGEEVDVKSRHSSSGSADGGGNNNNTEATKNVLIDSSSSCDDGDKDVDKVSSCVREDTVCSSLIKNSRSSCLQQCDAEKLKENIDKLNEHNDIPWFDDNKSNSHDDVNMTSSSINSSKVCASDVTSAAGKPKPTESRSQYHSIQQLCSPSSKSSQNLATPATATGYENPQRGDQRDMYDVRKFYDPKQMALRPGGGDTLDVLRGIMKVESFCRQASLREKLLEDSDAAERREFDDDKYEFYSEDEDERSFSSTSPVGSVSIDDFSDPEDIIENSNGEAFADAVQDSGVRLPMGKMPEIPNEGIPARVCDEGVITGERLEAKKARVENIISHMRLSPMSKSAVDTTPGVHSRSMYENMMFKRGIYGQVATPLTQPGSYGSSLLQPETRRPKRKQYIPQQHGEGALDSDQSEEPSPKIAKVEKENLQQELQHMHDQLADMQHKYLQLFDSRDQTAANDAADHLKTSLAERLTAGIISDINRNEIHRISSCLLQSFNMPGLTGGCGGQQGMIKGANEGASSNVDHLAKMLKLEITNSVGSLVDNIVKSFVTKHLQPSKENTAKESTPPKPASIPVVSSFRDQPKMESLNVANNKNNVLKQMSVPRPLIPVVLLPPPPPPPPPAPSAMHHAFQNHPTPDSFAMKQHRDKLTEKYLNPYFDLRGKSMFDPASQAHMSLFVPHPFFPSQVHSKFQPPLFSKEPEQTEALPLVVGTPKKKRTKVTDTRLSPRAARALLQESLHQHQHQQQHYQHHQHHQQQLPQHPSHQQQQLRQPSDWDSVDSAAAVAKAFHHRHHHYHHNPLAGIHDAFPHPGGMSVSGLQTSVAIQNPSLQHSDILQAMYSQASVMSGCRDSAVQFQHRGGSGQRMMKRSPSLSPNLTKTPKSDSDAFDLMIAELNYDGHGMISF